MVEILKSYPPIRQTFNMVPSLLEQIVDYAEGKAFDPCLKLSLKKAAELSDKDKQSMLNLFFQANYDNMIAPYPKYRELFKERRRAGSWGEAEWLDLQCLFNLAWIDPSFRKAGRLSELDRKGERFIEDEKAEILAEQRKIISSIIPRMREMANLGQIEISTSPYFHPIMPLLYDTDIAREALPDISLPTARFSHPEDVERHVATAVELYSNLFGNSPKGMWPSEGSVSEAIIPIIRKYGIEWMAADEEILAKSLAIPGRGGGVNNVISAGALYKCYRYGGESNYMNLFFRDHALSDNIGFVYSSWDPEKAADDFLARLKSIYDDLETAKIENPVVSIILDGENAWEFYKNDGHDFLNALYTKISRADWLETTTFSQYLAANQSRGELKKIFPGSWINHSFAVWIGHREKNRAWDLLSRARDELSEFENSNPAFDKGKLKLAWREIYIAEGSDWCWWFGDDHPGPHNDDFDRLFRSHLANIYYLTDREPPADFFSPVRSAYLMEFLSSPIDYITPKIDGKLTHFYEWHQAGFYDCLKAGSTMHRAENILAGIWFGFDPKNIYLRLDPAKGIDPRRFASLKFEIEFLFPSKTAIAISLADEGSPNEISYAFEDILEISIPFTFFKDVRDGKILFRVLIKEGGELLERWPSAEALKLEFPQEGSKQIPWVI